MALWVLVGHAMISRAPRLALLLAALASVAGCTVQPAEADDDTESEGVSEEELINGVVAREGDFRPTLLIRNSCTAAKVGPRHILTAAHCVGGLVSGGRLMFHTANVVNDRNVLSLAKYAVIDAVRVHPHYDRLDHMSDAADVAVITVRGTALDGIPSALVDLAPVVAGTTLTITGYGCRMVMMGGGTGDHTLSYANTKTVAASTLKLPYSLEQNKLIDTNFALTPGPATTAGVAGVCPGDSGGPVYRVGRTALTVAAVNSWTSGINQSGPKVNALARLHEGSRHSVGEWLSQQGIRLARPCRDAKKCTSPIPPAP